MACLEMNRRLRLFWCEIGDYELVQSKGYFLSLVFESVNNSFCKYKLYPFRHAVEARTIELLNLLGNNQPGVVAHACNPAAWRLGCLNGLRAGFLGVVVLCRSGVRAKFGVNMVNTEESEFSRLVKEERTGPGWKHSKQKLPRQTVVG